MSNRILLLGAAIALLVLALAAKPAAADGDFGDGYCFTFRHRDCRCYCHGNTLPAGFPNADPAALNCAKLTIKDCAFEAYPPDFSALTHLKQLVMASPPAELELRPSTWQLPASLVMLTLSRFSDETLTPGAFDNLPANLKALDIERNPAFTSLDDSVWGPSGNLAGLLYLRIGNNENLARIAPNAFSRFTNLRRLHIVEHENVPVLTSLPASLLSRLSNLETFLLRGTAVTTLPAGFFYGTSINPDKSIIELDAEQDVPAALYDAHEEKFDACSASCPSCTGSTNTCCHASCKTCTGPSAFQCTSCHNSFALENGVCQPELPVLAVVDSPADLLTGKYAAGYFSGFASCWVQESTGHIGVGYELDGKFCCRRVGSINAAGECVTHCGEYFEASFAYLKARGDGENMKCFTACGYLE